MEFKDLKIDVAFIESLKVLSIEATKKESDFTFLQFAALCRDISMNQLATASEYGKFLTIG